MAYKNKKKQAAHVKEVHKMGMGKVRKPKAIKKNQDVLTNDPVIVLPKDQRNVSFLDRFIKYWF